VLLAGCQFPADPDGTLDRVEGGVLRLGVTEHDPWVRLEGPRRTGVEVTLAQRFAASLGAELEFTEGAESELIDELKTGELDLVVGGFDSKSPWKKEAALTRPY
jgi:ABC-type amino acid transport substrate-binding protein